MIFISSPKCPYRLWSQPSLLFNDYRGSFRGARLPWHEVNRSPPSGAEIKNEWSYNSTPPICLLGVDRENFTFIFRLTLRQLLTNKIRERERSLRNKIKDFFTCHGRINSAQ